MEEQIEIYGPGSPDLKVGDKVLFRGHWGTIFRHNCVICINIPWGILERYSQRSFYGCQVRRAKPEPQPEPVVQIEEGQGDRNAAS